MKFGVSWSVKDIPPGVREQAQAAARRSGVSLGEWLNSVITQRAIEDGTQAPDRTRMDDLAAVNQRLDDLSRRIEQLSRTGPAAYAPKKSRNEEQLSALNQRLDRRLEQFASAGRPAAAMPNVQLPPSLERALDEIAARQRFLGGNAAPSASAPRTQRATQPPAATMSLPAQNLAGTLRQPDFAPVIKALREELAEMGRSLSEAMPRRTLDALERQVQELSQRVAEGRQAGIDAGALVGVEGGLAEVRDALHGLMSAENLIGFTDAIKGLAHKIDLIVAERDPTTLAKLESAITTLREMAEHVADNATVRALAAQVQELSLKVDELARASGRAAIEQLEQHIAALADMVSQRAQAGAVSPRLEALLESLTDKIERMQYSPESAGAFAHLEDRIVRLAEKLDASGSRLRHLEGIERALADLLVHLERTSNAVGLRAEAADVGELKQDLARTHSTLEAVHGTLGEVVERLSTIEKDIRSDERARATHDEVPLTQSVGDVAVPAVAEAPALSPAAARMPVAPAQPSAPRAAPRRLPSAAPPIAPDLPPDEPLEPGSGAPNANAAARIGASEATLAGTALPGASASKSNFIAAARRAAQAATQQPGGRTPSLQESEEPESEHPSLRDKMMKRVKSLFIAASIVAIVVGSIEIASNLVDFRNLTSRTAQIPAAVSSETATATDTAAPQSTASVGADPLALPQLPASSPALAEPAKTTIAATTAMNPQATANPQTITPSLLSAPLLSGADITGSIPRPAAPPQPARQQGDALPVAIGGPKLRNAANAGDAAAAYEIGMRYAEGRGVPADLEQAARWYERAAGKGLVPAQFRYASMLEKGQGVKKDVGEARRLYLAAAAKGNGKAMHNLAVLYAEGVDGRPDYINAVQWFRKAAQRGIADSQYNLAILCARGLGTAKSYMEAYKWFALAATQGDDESAKKRDQLAAHMDAASLASAQDSVKHFVAEPQPPEATTVTAPAGGWDNATSTPPRARPRPAGPMSLGALEVSKR
jgi:localization factor PodJL